MYSIEYVLSLKEEWKEEWERLKTKSLTNPVILVGAGCTSQFILKRFRENGIYPVMFVDNDGAKWGRKISDIKIDGVEKIARQYPMAMYYITTQLYYSQMYEQLRAIGVDEDNIIKHDLICQFQWEENYKEYVSSNKEEIQKFIDALEDDYSKMVAIRRFAFLVTRRRNLVTKIRGKIQYFEDFIDYKSLELFIDVGAYTGDSVLELEKYCGGVTPDRIIAFEMDENLYAEAKHNLAHLGKKLTLIRKACSDEDEITTLKSSLGKMQSISGDIFSSMELPKDGASVQFEACKIDSVLQDDIALLSLGKTFLKMDIEGAEMMALMGAKKFISTVHPMMAICVYHKADDVLVLSRFIRECYDGYKLKLRHYSDNQTETVLYAIP